MDNKGTVNTTTNVSDKVLKWDVAAVKQMVNKGEKKSINWCSEKSSYKMVWQRKYQCHGMTID